MSKLKWEQALEAIVTYELEVRDEFYCCDPYVFETVVNGCGPAGLGDSLVPDKHLGVSVLPACMLHDFEYNVGINTNDKYNADMRFKRNMERIDRAHSNWFTWPVRKLICWFYGRAVRSVLGCYAFINKTKREELLEHCK